MSNCTGVIYGVVSDPADGSPISGVWVDLNWVQRAEGGALTVGGDDGLTAWAPRCITTSSGKYIVPFFWASEEVPGDIASAHAIRFYDDNSYTSMNRHGNLSIGLDLRKLIGVGYPPIPASGPSAAGLFLRFWQAADKELKGTKMMSNFLKSFSMISTELQGCFSRIDFGLSYTVGSF